MRPNNEEQWMAGVVDRNIEALLQRRTREQRELSLQVRLADRITRFTGSMSFIYLHLLLFGGWIIWNLPFVPVPKFDPSYVVLAMFASVEAIFLSTFVLITQNRMSEQAAKRAELDLQVSLLAEHEVTELISLVRAVARKLEVKAAEKPQLSELEKDVAPEQVLEVIEQHQRDAEPEAMM